MMQHLDTARNHVAVIAQQVAFGSGNLPPDYMPAASSEAAFLETAPRPHRCHAMQTWFVARVRPGERDVRRTRESLAAAGYETYNPRFIERDRKRGEVLRPYFVGYLMFAVEHGQSWGEAARCNGVLAVLGHKLTGQAAALPVITIQHWRDMCGPLGIHDPMPLRAPVRPLAPGTPVTIDTPDGLFAGLHAIVRFADADRVKVLLDVMGGAVVDLPRSSVAVAAKAA